MPLRHDGSMELRALRYLVATADAGSVTQAAARLRVAQPAVSRQLRALEHELGATLLERTSRGVELTDAGQAFVADARELLSKLEEAASAARARSRGEIGELRLGYAPSPTAELLPAALEAFEAVAPNVRVQTQDLGGDELLEWLTKGRLNVALMVDPGSICPANVQFYPLRRYAHCVAFAQRHPFAKLKRVPLSRVVEEPLVIYHRSEYAEYYATLQRVLAPTGKPFRVALECDGVTSLVAALTARRGVAIVPEVFERFSGPSLRLRPIAPAPEPLVVGYAVRSDLPVTPVLRRFLAAAKKAAGR